MPTKNINMHRQHTHVSHVMWGLQSPYVLLPALCVSVCLSDGSSSPQFLSLVFNLWSPRLLFSSPRLLFSSPLCTPFAPHFFVFLLLLFSFTGWELGWHSLTYYPPPLSLSLSLSLSPPRSLSMASQTTFLLMATVYLYRSFLPWNISVFI